MGWKNQANQGLRSQTLVLFGTIVFGNDEVQFSYHTTRVGKVERFPLPFLCYHVLRRGNLLLYVGCFSSIDETFAGGEGGGEFIIHITTQTVESIEFHRFISLVLIFIFILSLFLSFCIMAVYLFTSLSVCRKESRYCHVCDVWILWSYPQSLFFIFILITLPLQRVYDACFCC